MPTLQRRQNYHETVKPRVDALVAAWPDAATTSGFRRGLDTGTLSEVISWPSPGRLAQMEDMTCVFERQGIETVLELRDTLGDHAKQSRSSGGPCGRAACQSQNAGLHRHPERNLHGWGRRHTGTRGVVQAAGVGDLSYGHMAAVIRAAAAGRG